MKKIDQTTFYPEGNCQSAVLAMLLDLPFDSIPNFFQAGKNEGSWWNAYYKFLKEQGFWFVSFVQNVNSKDIEARAKATRGFYEVSGPSSRSTEYGGNVDHAVVYCDGQLWHDPHPSREGLLAIREVRIYYPLEFKRLLTREMK